MASNEFLALTDSQSGEPVYMAPSAIIQITQIAEDEYPRRTRINTSHGYVFFVSEEATAIALATARGYQDVDTMAAADPGFSPTPGGSESSLSEFGPNDMPLG